MLCIRYEGKKNTCYSFVGEFLYLYWQTFGTLRSYGKIMENSVIREFSCLYVNWIVHVEVVIFAYSTVAENLMNLLLLINISFTLYDRLHR